MRDVCSLIWLALIGLFRSRASLQAEIVTLRRQLNVLRRKSPQRLTFSGSDRLVFAGLYRLAPGMLDALPSVLALEIKTSRWPSKDPADPTTKICGTRRLRREVGPGRLCVQIELV